jgi:hypothetical protein
MSRSRSSFALWIGIIATFTGLVLIYYGIDFPNTNMKSFVYPDIIGGALLVIGCALLGIGLVRVLMWLFGLSRD